MTDEQEMVCIAEKFHRFTPTDGPISLIARERRLIERALLLAGLTPAERLHCANCESSLDVQDAPLICATCREMGVAPSLIQRATELLNEADQLIKREGASDDARAVANVLANGIEDLLQAMRGKRYAMPIVEQPLPRSP